MKKKEEKKINPIAAFSGKTIDLVKFNIESSENQYQIIENTLKEIYGESLNVSKKHILKVINLTCNPKDDFVYLPYNLKVSKEKLNLNFTVEEKKPVSTGAVIFMAWLFIFALIGATYAGIKYLSLADLNKDIDGDGIADINIDINKDNKAEINIDTNNDKKPEVNIDYKGNRKAVFNIDTDGDGKADSNLVNDATKKDNTCKINCDTNGDGWPDLNLDLDGDGKADTDVDTDGDGVADLNMDVNGDGVCDVMCDTDGDNLCDQNCINTSQPGKQNGSSTTSGNPNIETSTPLLLVNYVDGVTVNVANLMPDDQPYMEGVEQETPLKSFTVENMSDYSITYSLKWNITYNTFTTDNYKYNLTATNGGSSFAYQTVPKTNDYIVKNVTIPAKVKQKYTMTFKLAGTNSPQNDDQGKVFQGYIEVEV